MRVHFPSRRTYHFHLPAAVQNPTASSRGESLEAHADPFWLGCPQPRDWWLPIIQQKISVTIFNAIAVHYCAFAPIMASKEYATCDEQGAISNQNTHRIALESSKERCHGGDEQLRERVHCMRPWDGAVPHSGRSPAESACLEPSCR